MLCICCSLLYCLFVFVVPHCNVYCVFVVLHCIVYLYLLFHVVMCIVYAPRVLFMHGDALVCRQTTNDFDGNENHLCFPSSSRKRMKFELFPKQSLLIVLSYRHVTAVSQDMNGCLSDRTMSPCQSLWIDRKYPLSKMINMTIGDDDCDDGVLIKGNVTISNRKLQH